MNIPPKSIKQQLARNGLEPHPKAKRVRELPSSKPPFARAADSPALRGPSGVADIESVSTESMPVLQAFQEFLEAERKHARRQVLAITSFFLMLFAIVTGAGAFFGYVYLGKLNADITFLHNELALAKLKDTQEAQDTGSMLAGLSQRTDALTERIADGDSLIKQATSEISNTVSNSLTVRLTEIDDIKAALADLRNENRTLKHDLARMRAIKPVEVAAADPTHDPVPAVQLTPPDNIETQLVSKLPKLPKANVRAPLEIAILAPGSSETMKWRIPIAE